MKINSLVSLRAHKKLDFEINHWFFSRIIFLILVVFLASFFIKFRPDFAYTAGCFYQQNCTGFKQLVYSFANFDGVHYLQIASQGYVDQARFLPLYPLLINFFSWPINQQVNYWMLFVALFLSNLAFYVFLKLLSKLRFSANGQNLNKKQLALLQLLFLSFPTSFFLSAVYTESLFLLLVGLMFLFLQKNQWQKALFFAMLLPLVKLQGIIIWPIFLLFLWQKKIIWRLKILDFFASVVVLVLPLAIYALFNFYTWQDPLYFIHAHGELANARATAMLVFPLQTVFRYSKILLTLPLGWEYIVAILEIASFFFACYLLILAWLKKVQPIFWWYSALVLSLPIFSGTFSGLPRYILLAFPLWVGLVDTKNQASKTILAITFFVLQIILLGAFARGYFVG